MRATRLIAMAVMAGTLAVSLLPGSGQAQIQSAQPAEFPPASYKGKQYVDSKGCVFIRAGIDGDVSWIPRVTRTRQPVCGFKPSLPELVDAAPATPSVEPETETADAVTLPAPTPTPEVEVPTAPVVVRQQPVTPVPQPRRVARAPAKVVVQKPAAVARVRAPDIAVVSDQPVQVSPNARILPRHLIQKRLDAQSLSIPHGYKPAWNDGRLNPRRAEQTLAGRQGMLLVWTQTVPRRLIDRRTGEDVTAKVPLVYPYTAIAQQRTALGEVTIVQRDGQTLKRIVRNQPAQPTPVLSSRSAPKKAPQARQVQRYLQVGTYRNADSAQRAARQIAAMGLRARIGTSRKGGRKVMRVQAGPFEGNRALNSALSRLQGAGYSDVLVTR